MLYATLRPFTRFLSFSDSAGGNSQATTGTGVSAKKLEDETEDFSSARADKTLSQ